MYTRGGVVACAYTHYMHVHVNMQHICGYIYICIHIYMSVYEATPGLTRSTSTQHLKRLEA